MAKHLRETFGGCSFCGADPIYKDGVNGEYSNNIACGNCFKKLHEPRALDPVSQEMAAQMREMLQTPDAPEDDGLELE